MGLQARDGRALIITKVQSKTGCEGAQQKNKKIQRKFSQQWSRHLQSNNQSCLCLGL